MIHDLKKVRNIGISAHVDSGKTTLTERILFYTHRIHAIHDVKGKDGVGAKMDSMDLERERGITIASASTYCQWDGHHINIIDTPGHVDFTIEVERSLRVLDGAILVICGVAGVQSQSYTVDRQMRRYKVPRLAFINKCDRMGSDPIRVRNQLRQLLGLNPVLLQLPIGLEDKFEGIVDLIKMKSYRFKGSHGENILESEIPKDMQQQASIAREEMFDAVSMFSDDLAEAILEDRVTDELVYQAIRQATIDRKIVPTLIGSAYNNKGVQPLLDAVVHYLPNPTQVINRAIDLEKEDSQIELASDKNAPLVAYAFKLEDGRYGQLTYLRVYQGMIQREQTVLNSRTRKKHRIGRLVRMHADEMEEIPEAGPGDIVGLFGIDCNSGDTFTDPKVYLTMTPITVPESVISLAIKVTDRQTEDKLSKALRRFTKEDPTFRVNVDAEANETIISGMGELHLDIYLERMRREYQVAVETSAPQVAYRETISTRADFDYTHKKQTGGAGQFGRVAGFIEPCSESTFEFLDQTKGGVIPRQFIAAVEQGFKGMLGEGIAIGAPVTNIRVVINDGKAHSVDSSEVAFQAAAQGAWRQAYQKAKPKILEPIMRVVVEGPSEFSGNVLTTLVQRRGMIIGSEEYHHLNRVEAEVPLSEMFGYATVLRSSTQGKAEFTMEFAHYQELPQGLADELKEKVLKRRAAKAKSK